MEFGLGLALEGGMGIGDLIYICGMEGRRCKFELDGVWDVWAEKEVKRKRDIWYMRSRFDI
jgi:hypothetical protein